MILPIDNGQIIPVKLPLVSQGLPLVSPIIDCFQSYGLRVKTLTYRLSNRPADATVACDPLPPPQTTMLVGIIIIKKNFSDTGD